MIVSSSEYKTVALYILYAVCIHTNVSILSEPKRSRTDGPYEVCLTGRVLHCGGPTVPKHVAV